MKTSKSKLKPLLATILFLLMGILGACTLFDKEDNSKSVARWGDGHKVEVSDETPVEVEDIYKEYHVTYTSVPTDSSYWYVILQIKREDGGWTTYHGTVALPMPYFDFYLAREDFNRDGESYFKYFEQITKEGFESFEKFKEENYK